MTIDVFIVEAITPDSTGVETLSSLEVGSPRGNRGMTSLVLGTTFLILEVDVEVPPFLVLEPSLVDPCPLLLSLVFG
jgi:hypothetical protein